MSKEYPLDPLALEIKVHWRKYRPKMYRQLEVDRGGRLQRARNSSAPSSSSH